MFEVPVLANKLLRKEVVGLTFGSEIACLKTSLPLLTDALREGGRGRLGPSSCDVDPELENVRVVLSGEFSSLGGDDR